MTTLAPKAPASQGAGAPRPQDKRSLLRRVLGPQPFGLLLGRLARNYVGMELAGLKERSEATR